MSDKRYNSIGNLDTAGGGDLQPGEQLGEYTLIEPVGRGGMGQVWKATDGKRHVAVKVLPTEFRGNSAAISQIDEAFRVVHALTHQHICKTLGLFDDVRNGPYLVMDFVPGITLSRYQRTFPDRRVPLPLALDILRRVAQALDYAHQKTIRSEGRELHGVLHRDVKPDNILLVFDQNQNLEEVWLIDFGLAAEIRNSMTKHTDKSFDTRGTRPYMAPEQCRGKRQQWDGRTDQYALAVVAYELLAGHLPFDGDDEFSITYSILNEFPDRILDLPNAAWSALSQGLAKEKETRHASCTALIDAIATGSTTGQPAAAPPARDRPDPQVSPPVPQKPLEGLAAQVANAASSAAQWHEQARAALSRFDYAAAAELLERIPLKLRNQQQWRDAAAKRDRLAELEATISRLVSEHEYRKLISPVQESLRLDPKRDDLQALLATLPDLRLRPGTQAGERTVIDFNDLEIAFRWCPAGKFKLGSPASEAGRSDNENQVAVELTQGFWLGETVVTQALFQAVLNADPSHFKGSQRPVETVSWDEAQAFCQKLTDQLREAGVLAPAWRVCLPTEARWEYACRAGTTTAYYFGNDAARLGQFAWFDGNSGKETHPVGAREANAWGLHDMHGNVWEWCADWYGDKLVGGTNPAGPATGSNRVNRGGSWISSAGYCRSAGRDRDDPSDRFNNLGFRVCLSSD